MVERLNKINITSHLPIMFGNSLLNPWFLRGCFSYYPSDPKIKKDLPDFGGKFRGDSLREGIDPKAVHFPR